MIERVFDSMFHWYRLVGGASDGARALERDGVLAAVVPAAPERAVVNAVLYRDAAALEAAYDEVAAAYREIGAKWTVWVRPGDEEAARLLESARPRARRAAGRHGARARRGRAAARRCARRLDRRRRPRRRRPAQRSRLRLRHGLVHAGAGHAARRPGRTCTSPAKRVARRAACSCPTIEGNSGHPDGRGAPRGARRRHRREAARPRAGRRGRARERDLHAGLDAARLPGLRACRVPPARPRVRCGSVGPSS